MLCYLFDSKRISVDQFAKLTHLDPRYVERLAHNDRTAIDGTTRLDVVRTIKAFHSKFPDTRPPSEYDMAERHRKLELVGENHTPSRRKGTPRGVFQEDDSPAGETVFKSINSRGVRCERREYASADLTPQIARRIVRGMERYLDEVDPVLEAVESSDT